MEEKLEQIKAIIIKDYGSMKNFCNAHSLHEGTMSKFFRGKVNILSDLLFSILDILDLDLEKKS